MSEPLFIHFNDCIVKSRPDATRRLIEIEASSEQRDLEGDVILQEALLNSADSFIKNGHTDVDHLSEIGARYGIANPSSYIIGHPLEVTDLGNQRTGVVIEIMQSNDGSTDIQKNKYDEFWDSLQKNTRWMASVFGYPIHGLIDDCSEVACSHGATRYLIKGLDWRSIAVTKNPMNQTLTGNAKIITAKAQIEHLQKSMDYPLTADSMPVYTAPRSMDEIWGSYERHIAKDCPMSGGVNTRMAFKAHFQGCCGLDTEQSNILAHALMMMLIDKNKKR